MMGNRNENPMVSPNLVDWLCDRMVAFWTLVFGPRQIEDTSDEMANAEQATTEINPLLGPVPSRLDLFFDYGPRAFFVGRPVGEKKVYTTPAPRTVPLPKPPKPPKAEVDETAREANREAARIKAEARAADKAAKAKTDAATLAANREATRIRAEAHAADKVAKAKADAEALVKRREAEDKAAEARAANMLAEAQAMAEDVARRREAANIKAQHPKPIPRLKPQRWWKRLWQQRQAPPPPPPAAVPPTNEAPPPPATTIPPETATFETDEDHTDPHEKAEDPQIPHGASGLIRLGALGELRPLAAPKNPLGGPDGAEAPPVEEVHSLLDLRSSNEAREAVRLKPPAAPPPLPRQTLPETAPSTTEVQPMRRITEDLPAISSPPLVVGPPSLPPSTEAADRLISKSDQAGLLRQAGFPEALDDEPMSAEELARDPEVLENYERAFGVPHPGSVPKRVEQPTAPQTSLSYEDSWPLPFEVEAPHLEDEDLVIEDEKPKGPPPIPHEDLSGLIELNEVPHEPTTLSAPAATTTSSTTTDDSAELAAMSDSFRSNRTLVGFLLGIFSFVYLVGAAIGTLSLFNQDSVEWWQYAITVSLFIPPTIIAIVLLRRHRKQLAAA